MSQISMVFQKVYLFHDTIKNNIKFGKPDAIHEQVVAAAKKACYHDFISALPDGYDTICTPELFSQGQWQLLSIARAAVASPRLLLLDEITANLDAETEKEVLQALKRVSGERTVISISHRTSAEMGRVIPIG